MATFVLVHGAMHGGWCWKRVTPHLHAAGHDVYTPTLTGLGERAHLLTPEVDLATHIQDVVNLLFYEDLRDVVLVGHSLAGMVIPGVADIARDRVGQLVFLAAAVPKAGQSFADSFPDIYGAVAVNAVDVAGVRVVPPFARELFATWWHITDTDDLDWLEIHLSPQPLAVLTGALELSRDIGQLPCCYIRCVGPPGTPDPPDADADRARALGWDMHELQTGHNAAVTAPRELADLLVQIAER
jgi:pimeloyl-ACP methyl ester carboxylesterase